MPDGKADYGVDAPGLVRGFALAGLVALVGVAALVYVRAAAHWVGGLGVVLLSGMSVYCVSMAAFMLYYSKVIKVAWRDRLLDLVPWADHHAVLDIGCGRGLLTIAAARRVPGGRVTGIDLWRASDQSGNSPQAAESNARIEGVADRVDIRTGDMRQLPFSDASFDLVVSHWAVHNLEAAADRAAALAEMARVLRPGGHMLLADIAHRSEYAGRLAALGLADVRTVVDRLSDLLLAVISMNSFRPATVVGRKP